MNSLEKVKKVINGKPEHPPPLGCLFPAKIENQKNSRELTSEKGWDWIGVYLNPGDYIPGQERFGKDKFLSLKGIFKIGILEGPFQKHLFKEKVRLLGSLEEFSPFLIQGYLELQKLIEMNLKNCDAFLLAEDFLYQRGLMFSPAFFRTNILEGIQELANLSSKSGKPFGFHADGDFSPILGDLRKIGIKFIHGFDLVNLNHQDIKGFSLIVPKGIFLTDFPILWDDDPPD